MHGEDPTKLLAELLCGTSIENDEHELAQLRKLSLQEQLEVALVLYTAMLQEKGPPSSQWNKRLEDLGGVADAQRALFE